VRQNCGYAAASRDALAPARAHSCSLGASDMRHPQGSLWRAALGGWAKPYRALCVPGVGELAPRDCWADAAEGTAPDTASRGVENSLGVRQPLRVSAVSYWCELGHDGAGLRRSRHQER
jgi:hypothetical protein